MYSVRIDIPECVVASAFRIVMAWAKELQLGPFCTLLHLNAVFDTVLQCCGAVIAPTRLPLAAGYVEPPGCPNIFWRLPLKLAEAMARWRLSDHFNCNAC